MRTKISTILLIALPLLFALFLMFRYVDLPYIGPNATDPNTLSLAARNYNNWGYLNTKFAIIKSLSLDLPKNPDIYLHHPIFMVVVESLFFKVLGYGFWVGRISIILPAFLSIVLIFLTAKGINKKIARWALIIAALVPATVVFGRMIHYAGAWTLFFMLAIAYFSLKYIKNNRKIFLVLAIISAILGTLSDWPVTYFTPFLLPLMIKNKKKWEGVLLIAASTITAASFLVYSYFVLGSFKNISDAILNRSVGPLLLALPLWPLHWISILLTRFILYFDPLFLVLSGIYVFYFIKKFLKKKLENFDLLIFAFFACGITHIVLYPEGSFGHPFWIYLLVPFIAFSGAKVIVDRFSRSKLLLITMVLLAVVFALRIEDWKTQQNLSNLFRYNLAKSVSSYFIPYDTLLVNPGSYIDVDLYQYSFYQNAKPVQSPVKDLKELQNANYYVYSCIGCNLNNPEVNFLAQEFKYKSFDSPPGRVYIFFLKQKQNQEIPLPVLSKASQTPVGTVPEKESLLRKTYIFLIGLIKAPQI